MKSAVDTNILFDLLNSDPAAETAAEQALAAALAAGSLAICPVVSAELAVGFADRGELEQFLQDVGLQVDAFSPEALWHSSMAWRNYLRRRGRRIQCPRCGTLFDLACPSCQSPITWRQHVLTDFLIGGHAMAQADLLITRDPGYFRTYFPDLPLVVPGRVS